MWFWADVQRVCMRVSVCTETEAVLLSYGSDIGVMIVTTLIPHLPWFSIILSPIQVACITGITDTDLRPRSHRVSLYVSIAGLNIDTLCTLFPPSTLVLNMIVLL